jgi:hypothetical protein
MKNSYELLIFVALVTIFSCDKMPNDHYIEIKDKKQHVLTLGKGEPVVVFLAGGGSDLTDFDSVQRAISKITKTFSYDKPGIGKSELINSPRTLDNVAEEMKELLDKEGISNSPMIFVGHSMGGDVSRYFLHRYPRNIVGLVLIDPGNEFLSEELRKNKTEKEKSTEDSLLAVDIKTLPIGFQMEIKCYPKHDSLLKTFSIKTNIPITLLESNNVDSSSEELIEIQKRLYRDFQKKVPQMKIISTEKSGHFIQLDEPYLVIDAIKSMIKEVR